MDASALLAEVLDEGDRLLQALWDHDLPAAERALDARQEALDRLLGSPRPGALDAGAVARFSAQDARLQATLGEHLREAGAAAETATRTRTAQSRYLGDAREAQPRLDTAPR